MPPINKMGMNTATSDRVMDTTVNAISFAPRNAASRGGIPCSRYRLMFSRTTMASSTTKPVAIASAMSERLSRLYPQRYMTPNVAMSETGTATLGMSAARTFRRKTKTTKMTSRTEMAMPSRSRKNSA